MRFSGRLSGILLVVATLLFGLVGVVPAQAADTGACAALPFPPAPADKARVCGQIEFRDGSGQKVNSGGRIEFRRVNPDGTTTVAASYDLNPAIGGFLWLSETAPGTYIVAFDPAGQSDFLPTETGRLQLAAGGEYAPTLTPQLGSRVAGTVASAPGLSSSNVAVFLERKAGDSWQTADWTGAGRAGTWSSFSFRAVAPGTYRVSVRVIMPSTEGYAAATPSEEFTVALGKDPDSLALAAATAPAITGRLRMADGSALPRMPGTSYLRPRPELQERVSGDPEYPSGWRPIAQRSDSLSENGQFTLKAQDAGTFRVVVNDHLGEYWAVVGPFELGLNARRDDVDVEVRRSGVLAGTLGFVHRTPSVALVAEEPVGDDWTEVGRIDYAGGAFELNVPGAISRQVRLRVTSLVDRRPDVFWDGTKYGTTDASRAKSFAVSSDRTTSIGTLTLQGDDWPDVKIRSVKVTGTASVGSVLRATVAGVEPAKARISYRWLRNGKAIAGATKSTYRLTSADRGKRVSVRVAGSAYRYDGAKVTSKSTPVIRNSVSLKVTSKAGARKATLRVSLTSKGVKTSSIKGTVVVYLDGKKIKTAKVRKGKASVVLNRQKAGARQYVVRYSGQGKLGPVQRTVKVRVR